MLPIEHRIDCTRVMGIGLHHVKMVVRDHDHTRSIFSVTLPLFAVKKITTQKNLPMNRFPFSWQTWWCKFELYISFCTIVLV